ncbi:hypothetical protein GQ53DRAFT_398906 [Thozetella sp. PMI_491]|nr:hypothetical protein GQ53DRAFT_398906 [Thozetella sp. PMI_491]
MSSQILPSSDVSRPKSRAHVPAPALESPQPRSPDLRNDGHHSRRRRPAAAGATDDLLKPAIVVKPYPSNLQSQPRTLNPLMLLPRENLSLSSLDLCNPNGVFPSSRFYESSIKILELEGRLGSNILLARSETNQMVYAVEREKKGLYTLCKLGSWVDVTQFTQYATAVCSQRMQATRPPPMLKNDSFAITTLQSHHEEKKKRLAIEELQSVVRKRPRSQGSLATPDIPSQAPAITRDESSLSSAATPAHNEQDALEPGEPSLPQSRSSVALPAEQPLPSEEAPQPTAEGIFQNIRTQYIDILYHSMGSLAYFAKGPLSRARAAFHLDCDSNLDMSELIEFLKSLVMTTVLIDKKYRETVPDIISKMKMRVEDSDGCETKGKKRKTKKMKLGKDGLYPTEDENIRRWWSAHKPAASAEEDRLMSPEEIKYHISCLRGRETQLQMILILEILALELLRPTTENAEESQLPGMDSGAPSGTAASKNDSEPGPKKRNRHNLPFLLDIHADRLCIWQSTTLDEVKALAESQVVIQGDAGENPARSSSDPLKDFCVDIILPFFSARLPDLCDSVNRKLGGPVIKSPPKPKQQPKSASTKAKPGAPAKRAGSSTKKARGKTIEEVLSKEKMRRSVSRGPDAVALLRSASVAFVPTLKKENSEPVLSAIPKGEPGSLKERPVNVFGRAYSTGAGDMRAKKKAQIEAELQDAISALKRPNRALAAKEITDAAERRASTGSLKRLKRPTRALASAVQVKATPANNRFKDVLGTASLQGDWDDAQLDAEDFDKVPSSASVVPSTVVRKKSTVLFGSAMAATPLMDRLPDTPARISSNPPPLLQFLRSDESAIPQSSPTMARRVAPGGSSHLLSVPDRPMLALPSSPGLGALFETPLKPRSAMGNLHALDETPIKSRLPVPPRSTVQPEASRTASGNVPQPEKERSIYQQLGWDDDDDLI